MSFIVSDNTNSSTQGTWGYSYNVPMLKQEEIQKYYYYSKPIISLNYNINYSSPDYSGPQIALDDFKQTFKYSTAVNFCNDIEFYRTFYKDDMKIIYGI